MRGRAGGIIVPHLLVICSFCDLVIVSDYGKERRALRRGQSVQGGELTAAFHRSEKGLVDGNCGDWPANDLDRWISQVRCSKF